MPSKNRTTLKNYFKSGSLPSEDQFEDLIDSMLNMRDEGFEKSAREGFKVAQLPEGKLISFFEDITVRNPIWSFKIDLKSESRKLCLLNEDEKEILTLTPDGNVGIKQNQPAFELEIAGTMASRGRIGEKGARKVHANGYWQNITETLEGCHAFEIMAGVGKPKSGKYALMHAFALKTFNKKGKIVYHQAHYGSRCNRLKLRWRKEPDQKYRLQLKTRSRYGEVCKSNRSKINGDKSKQDVGVYVKYYITRLWFDQFMQNCLEE